MVTMAVAAAVTQRVRLALTVIVLPMHSELLMAKQIATLDVLSGGRVSLGVGVGARAEDYRAAGAEFDAKRFRRMEHQVERMRRVWSGENLVDQALRPIEPYPLQAGGPEVLAGSLFPWAIRRAARWADGLCGFSFGPSPREVEMSFETARQAWKATGRPSSPRLVMCCWFALGAHAREQLDTYLARYLNFLGAGVAEQVAPTVRTSSVGALRETIGVLAGLGADELLLVPTTSDPEEVERVAQAIG
jgi:alkanesulfonate monooxygenase SsuD/methylene tetrahydromethanopterin reductase-like flavin-dependent oxidoreductase (luciferase family)